MSKPEAPKPEQQSVESERQHLLDREANAPAANLFYRGKTPKEVAKMIFQAKPTKRGSK